MARRGENIYKRRDGRYEGRYVLGKKPDGSTKFGYVYARQYGEARRLLWMKKASTLRQATDFGLECRHTLRDWAAEWMRERLRAGMKPSTRQTYGGALERYILPMLGDYLLCAIAPEDVRALLAQLAARGLAESTIRVTFRLLSGILRGAQEGGMLRENPCKCVKMCASARPEQRVLTAAEQRDLLRSAQGAKDAPALLSLYTGLRLGEVCALRWCDVDWARGTVTVRYTALRARSERGDAPARTRLGVNRPKSANSRRTVPVPAVLLEMLRELQGGAAAEDYIFGGARPAEPRTLQRRFQGLARRAGLRGAHFHTLRHSFATRMLELGVDVKTISRLLGHGSVRTTLDCYAHSLLDSQRRAIDRLASAMR